MYLCKAWPVRLFGNQLWAVFLLQKHRRGDGELHQVRQLPVQCSSIPPSSSMQRNAWNVWDGSSWKGMGPHSGCVTKSPMHLTVPLQPHCYGSCDQARVMEGSKAWEGFSQQTPGARPALKRLSPKIPGQRSLCWVSARSLVTV